MCQEECFDERTQRFEEIRNTVVDFLNRCEIAYPRNIYVDISFDKDCEAECNRRGYDMKTLSPFLRVGIDIADCAYSHLENKKIKRYIAIYTAFLTYLDDFCQTEAGIANVASFVERFINNQPQGDKMLDDLASVLKEINVYWRPITASLILSASICFVSSLFLDNETKDMQLGRNAVQYPSFSRRLSGISESYVAFAFPPEMPTS